MYPDFLTCGRCAGEFPLSRINDFILHKTACLQVPGQYSQTDWDTTAVLSQPVLSCFICQQDFHTALGVLQHIQYTHEMDIVQQKTPFPFQQPFDGHNQQVTTIPTVPINSGSAVNRTGPIVATTTTISDPLSTMVSHTTDDVGADSLEKEVKTEAMPATCAKLSSTEGTTICCNGKECQVIINSPNKSPPPKKCCSSVVPKKRNRHMQEHDSEDMEQRHDSDIEQSVLETLATLRGRALQNQKSKLGTKKGKKSSRSLRRSKARCIGSCEREDESVAKASEDSEAEGKEEESCRVCDRQEEDSDSVCHEENNSYKRDNKRRRVDLYSIEKDSITCRKTVIMNSGVTVTLEPTETSSSKKDPNHPISQSTNNNTTPAPPAVSGNQTQLVPSLDLVDASRESAQILAELLYRNPVEQSMVAPVQSLQAATANSQICLASLTESVLTTPLPEPAGSGFMPPSNTNFSSTNPAAFINTLNPMLVNSNLPQDMQMNISATGSPQVGIGQPPDIQHLPDLDALTPSIQPFPALDPISQHGAGLGVPDVSVAFASFANSTTNRISIDSSTDDAEGRKMAGGKKRRYPTSRPHKCPQCDQAFNQPIHLKKHMSKHTGVKPFKCENCEYSTVERSHLKAHNRIHTGEKPFRCQFCSYATAQNSTLKVHLRRHHQDKQAVSVTTASPARKEESSQQGSDSA